jgi:hypothetical protein
MKQVDNLISRNRSDVVFAAFAVFLGTMAGFAVNHTGIVLGLLLSAVLLAVAIKNPSAYFCIIIASTFLSRFSFSIGGLNLRAEMAAGAISGAALLLKGSRKLDRNASTVIGLGLAWVIWLFLVSLLTSPNVSSSTVIVAWLVFDLMAVAYAISFVTDLSPAIYTGITLAFIYSLLSIGVWVAATIGTSQFLVQLDPTYGGYAAYVTVFEANILAALVVLWSVVALSDRLAGNVPMLFRVGLVALTPLVAVVTHTRIAFVVAAIVLVTAVFKLRKVRWFIIIWTASLLLLLFQLDLEGLSLSKFTSPFSLDDGTGRYRSRTWAQAFADLGSNGTAWLTGLGANSFGQRHLDPSLPGSGARWYLGNLPLQLVYDGGVVAVIILGILASRLIRVRPSTLSFVFAGSYLILGISTSTLWLMQSWIFIAILLVSSTNDAKKYEIR